MSSTIKKSKQLLVFLNFWVSQTLSAEEIPVLENVYIRDTLIDRSDETQYTATSASTSTRTVARVKDTPQSVDIRTEKLINDLGGLKRTDELAKTVAGVHVSWNGNGGTNTPILNIRGFSNSSGYDNSDFLKDGYRKLASISRTMDLANVERIEFLKGPSSVLYGKTDNLGGVMNLISKRPQANPHQHFDFTVGSNNFYRSAMDVGSTLNEDKSALLRINAALEDADSFRDFAEHQTQFFAPAFSFDFSDRDRLSILLDFTNSNLKGDFGLPITSSYAQIPVSTYMQDPNFDGTHTWLTNSLFEYTHLFKNDWKLTLALSSSWSEWSQHYNRLFVTAPNKIDHPLLGTREPNTEHSSQEDRNLEAVIDGHVQLAGIDHHLLFGSGYIRNDNQSDGALGNTSSFNLLIPDYGKISPLNAPLGFSSVHSENLTGFAQDLISINQYLKLLLGVRYDQIRQQTLKQDYFGVTGSDTQTDTRVSPRYGIVFQPADSTSLYASYTSSFAQRINDALDPQARYKPELGEQIEIGLKQSLSNSLNLNLALYQLTRENVLLRNINNVPHTSRQTGEQQSQGLEISLIGEVNDQLRLTGAYSWMKAQITKDNELSYGTERVGVPNHSLNLFGVYKAQQLLPGLEIGMGLNYTSSVQVSMPSSFKLPDTLQLDGLLSYQLTPHYKIQANIKNLGDNKNYLVTEDFGYITVTTPRTVYISFSADF